MYRHLLTITLLASTALAGCATPLSPVQKAELDVYRSKGLEVVEKKPGTATALGVLPGGGSFYTRNYGLGTVNLLLWPLSVLWDPISGRDGAETINYQATKGMIDSKRANEMRDLETKLSSKQITSEAYLQEKTRIDRKYAPQL